MKMPPFKIKMVEPVKFITRKERADKLRRAYYNPFFLSSEDVMVDLLTDSGTGAMSEDQWAALMQGDESYAGSTSFAKFKRAIYDILGFPFIIPAHQGRGAEGVFNAVFVKKGSLVIGNAPFDTTRAHIESRGGIILDCTTRHAFSKKLYPFKGNVDIKEFRKAIANQKKDIAYALLTLTCNSVGGQPVSLANIRGVARVCHAGRIPLFFDIARFAENAFFIKEREGRYRVKPIRKIISDMMSYADGAIMSAKKDAIANIGGFIALRHRKHYENLAPHAILREGFLSYGGMSGRDMETIAQGLHEGIDEDYLRHRVGQVKYLGEVLSALKIPVLLPTGGHAVYINAGSFLPHIPWNQFPGQALAIALYIEGGIRGVEIGSIMQGRDPVTRKNRRARRELLRLAIPRRVYAQEHLDHVIDTFKTLTKRKRAIRGVAFQAESPILRHFSSKFKILE